MIKFISTLLYIAISISTYAQGKRTIKIESEDLHPDIIEKAALLVPTANQYAYKKYGLKLGIYLSTANLYQIESKDRLYGNLSKYTERVIETAPEQLKSLLQSKLKIYWDNQNQPAINLPMPFLKNAKIEVEADNQELILKMSCVVTKHKLETQGTGHYIGTFLRTKGKTHGNECLPVWLEGDEVFVCDGEIRAHGTGTEDYFNCGWYAVEGRLNKSGSFPLHGFPEYEMNRIGKASAYRWHLLDPIPFKNSIRATVEHGTYNTIRANYKSAAFYYIMKNKN